uniref:Kinesin motor domain-containing protein n=1 Tax=Eutreptiella gymnastica TaxID=73025 RepID=A0A7S1N8U4_9EUGL
MSEGGKQYGFDGCFYDNVTQKNVFNTCILPVLRNVADGYQSAVLAYGQTGSGKTHTMRGKDDDPDMKGVIPRVAGWLYDRKKNEPSLNMEIALQYVQIYLGKPRDLLDMKKKEIPDFQIKPGKDGADDELIFVNVHTSVIPEYDQFMKECDGAEKHKVVRATAMNPESSRGHSAMVIQVTQTLEQAGVSSVQRGKLFLVDLAGYEQAALIGTDGDLKEETKHINETLLGLNRIMSALSRKEKHIPYREYKLTLMLKDALSTKTRSTVMLTLSPALDYKAQSMNTIHFGQSAMAVKVKATLAVVSDWKGFAQTLQGTCGQREERIRTLKTWFEKLAPKELAQYEAQFGKIEEDEYDEGTTDVEEIFEKFKDAHGGKDVHIHIDDESDDDVDLDDVSNNNVTDANLAEKVAKKLAKRQKMAEQSFEREIAQMKAQHAEEIKWMEENGKSAEEIAALKREHVLEIKFRTDVHFESMEFVNQQANAAKTQISFRILTRLSILARRAKAKCAGPYGSGAAMAAIGNLPSGVKVDLGGILPEPEESSDDDDGGPGLASKGLVKKASMKLGISTKETRQILATLESTETRIRNLEEEHEAQLEVIHTTASMRSMARVASMRSARGGESPGGLGAKKQSMKGVMPGPRSDVLVWVS